jgi:cation:H+ antiporter
VLVLIGLAVAGLAVLTVGADHLVIGAGRIAARLRVAPVIVGVVVIGLGTSAPEFLVSGLAAARGDVELAAGNLIGSNILNLTLILGIAALVAPVAVRSTVVRREAPLSVCAVLLFGVLAAINLGPLAGAVLAVAGVGAMTMLVRLAFDTPDRALPGEVTEFLDDRPRHSAAREGLRTALGLAGTLVGAQLLVTNAAEMGARLGVSQVVIGFTVVAVGTSLPELVTAVQAQRRGESDLLVGNLLGSNLFNSLGGGAVVGLAAGSTAAVRIDVGILAAMVFVTLLAWALLFRGQRVSHGEAGVLLAAYLLTLPMLV